MSISVGDVLRLTSCQNIFGELACNVFFYVVAAWTGNLDYEDILDEFNTTVSGAQAAMQTSDVVYDNLLVENVTNGIDFASLSTGLPTGAKSPPTLPSYVAAGFRLDRATAVTRNGFKRIAGIRESGVVENEFTDATDPTAIAYAGVLDSPLILDVNDELTPVIVGRLPGGGLDLTKLNNIQGVTIKDLITTQNSRKES